VLWHRPTSSRGGTWGGHVAQADVEHHQQVMSSSLPLATILQPHGALLLGPATHLPRMCLRPPATLLQSSASLHPPASRWVVVFLVIVTPPPQSPPSSRWAALLVRSRIRRGWTHCTLEEAPLLHLMMSQECLRRCKLQRTVAKLEQNEGGANCLVGA
jgi:hypothetical protein